MIIGLGIDLCSISRMEKAIGSKHFRERIFHTSEIEYSYSKASPAHHFAASFATREAFSKASSISMYFVAFQGVWVERSITGPILQMRNDIKARLSSEQNSRFFLSLSHDGDYAVAVVVIEATDAFL